MKTPKLIVAFLAVFAIAAQAQNTYNYIITGSGTEFTATRNNSTTVGTANKPIQSVIDAIKTNANGAACTIQFSNSSDALDIGEAYITFSGSGSPIWGLITLTGKITSSNTSYGTIYLTNGASINSTADIANTGNSGSTIYNSIGTVTISGGTVSATGSNGRAIYNSSTGAVIVIGGTVTATSGTQYQYTNSDASGTIIVWNTPSAATYTAFTNTNITLMPTTATARWLNKDGSAGIDYANASGTVTGFVATSGVTVNKATIPTPPTYLTATLGQTLADVALPDGWTWVTPSDAVGEVGTQTHKADYACGSNCYDGSNISVSINVKPIRMVPVITTQPVNKSVIAGSSVSFTVAASGIPAPTYQWQINANGTTFTNISGATSATYTVSAVATSQNGYKYRCIVTNAAGTATSNAATLTVNIAKASGATVATPVLASKTHNSITIIAVAAPSNGQSVEYGIALADATAVWQAGTIFESLSPETNYYIFARAVENANYNTGTASAALQVTTEAEPVSSSSSDDETPIRLPQIATGSLHIQATTNAIILENLPANAKVEVYNLQGKQIYSTYSENSKILKILVQTKGIYIVKVKNKALRVMVI